jgi:hypothetical protein
MAPFGSTDRTGIFVASVYIVIKKSDDMEHTKPGPMMKTILMDFPIEVLSESDPIGWLDTDDVTYEVREVLRLAYIREVIAVTPDGVVLHYRRRR